MGWGDGGENKLRREYLPPLHYFPSSLIEHLYRRQTGPRAVYYYSNTTSVLRSRKVLLTTTTPRYPYRWQYDNGVARVVRGET